MAMKSAVSKYPTAHRHGSIHNAARIASRYRRTVTIFDAPGHDWTRVSPRLATVRRILALPVPIAVALAASAVALAGSLQGLVATLLLLLAAGALSVAAWLWVWAGRNAASWGYAEADDDLLVTGGVMFRRLVAVPYGRMQFVDVTAGPLDRAFGIATVTLHTASTRTAAGIPGVPKDEAARLRDRLTTLGESHGAGI